MNRIVGLCLVTLAVLSIGCEKAAPEVPQTRVPQATQDTPATEIHADYWLNTEPLSLEGLRGRIVVVEFWATWCPPCRVSIPHLMKLHERFGPKGVVIVSLTAEPKETVEPFVRQMGMPYAVGGGSDSGKAYGVRGIPAAFVIDPSGNIVWQGHPMGDLDRAIEDQLEKNPPTAGEA